MTKALSRPDVSIQDTNDFPGLALGNGRGGGFPGAEVTSANVTLGDDKDRAWVLTVWPKSLAVEGDGVCVCALVRGSFQPISQGSAITVGKIKPRHMWGVSDLHPRISPVNFSGILDP